MLEPSGYITAVEREGAALASAVEAGDPEAVVPGCPDWSVADLARHIGAVHRWATSIIETRATERLSRRDIEQPQDATVLPDWLRAGVEVLVATLRTHDPSSPVWTWAGPGNVGWWQRRMAQETLVHRWDAQDAASGSAPLDPALAADGVDEYLGVFVPTWLEETRWRGTGSVHLHATDADGEWHVTLTEAAPTIRREHAKGDVAVRGRAEDLLLGLWRRQTLDRLEFLGEDGDVAKWRGILVSLEA